MLFKLSMSGLRGKLKDYIVLLIGLIMSIAIFYMFQTLALNKAFLEENAMVNSIEYIFQTGSILLAIITCFYIFYANSFLLSLRKKEFGMYMTLGAKKYKVTILMFMETMVLGAVSLAIGITVGTGLAQGIGKLLMKQLDFSADGYQALFVPSIAITCIFYLFLFIFSAVMNNVKLLRIPILGLVHGDTHSDTAIIKGKKMTSIVSGISIILLGIGYTAMIYLNKLEESGIMIAMLATTGGTYLFFESVFPLFVRRLKANKTLNDKGLNAFTLAQLNFRINGLTKVLATVAMLIALGSGAISGGFAYQYNVIKATDSFEIYDSVIQNPTSEEMDILENIPFNEKGEYRYKVDDQFINFVREDLVKKPPLIYDENGSENKIKFTHVSDDLPAGSVSRYGQETDKHTNFIPEQWETALISIETIYSEPFNKPIKIVDQNTYNDLQGETGSIFVGKTNDFIAHTKEWKRLDELQLKKYDEDDISMSKYEIYRHFYTIASGTVFMGFFLGIAFLAMMASCLMFKILSGATTDIARYEMLRKIGVHRRLLSRSIYKELFITFLVPAIIGMGHVLIGMNIFRFVLIDPYYRIWLPILIFLVVYTVYYFITVHLYKGIVLPRKGL